jgi:hypothetical protein
MQFISTDSGEVLEKSWRKFLRPVRLLYYLNDQVIYFTLGRAQLFTWRTLNEYLLPDQHAGCRQNRAAGNYQLKGKVVINQELHAVLSKRVCFYVSPA